MRAPPQGLPSRASPHPGEHRLAPASSAFGPSSSSSCILIPSQSEPEHLPDRPRCCCVGTRDDQHACRTRRGLQPEDLLCRLSTVPESTWEEDSEGLQQRSFTSRSSGPSRQASGEAPLEQQRRSRTYAPIPCQGLYLFGKHLLQAALGPLSWLWLTPGSSRFGLAAQVRCQASRIRNPAHDLRASMSSCLPSVTVSLMAAGVQALPGERVQPPRNRLQPGHGWGAEPPDLGRDGLAPPAAAASWAPPRGKPPQPGRLQQAGPGRRWWPGRPMLWQTGPAAAQSTAQRSCWQPERVCKASVPCLPQHPSSAAPDSHPGFCCCSSL